MNWFVTWSKILSVFSNPSGEWQRLNKTCGQCHQSFAQWTFNRNNADQCTDLFLDPKFCLLFLTQLMSGRDYTNSAAGAANHWHNGHFTGIMQINALICAFYYPTGEWQRLHKTYSQCHQSLEWWMFKRNNADQCIELFLDQKFCRFFLTQLVSSRDYTNPVAGAANHLHNGHLTGIMQINALICFLIQNSVCFF